MASRAVASRRAKVSATVDAVLLREVDDFVADHPGLTRSEVLDDALRLWSARERERAIEAQYTDPEPLTKEDIAEREAWRRIRDAAAADRLFRTR